MDVVRHRAGRRHPDEDGPARHPVRQHGGAARRSSSSHVIYSDDGGKTWKQGGVLGEKTNECQVVELRDGRLLLNMRSYHGKNRRAVADQQGRRPDVVAVTLEDEALIEPVCQASLIRCRRRRRATRCAAVQQPGQHEAREDDGAPQRRRGQDVVEGGTVARGAGGVFVPGARRRTNCCACTSAARSRRTSGSHWRSSRRRG